MRSISGGACDTGENKVLFGYHHCDEVDPTDVCVDDATSVAVDWEEKNVKRYNASPRALAMDACLAKYDMVGIIARQKMFSWASLLGHGHLDFLAHSHSQFDLMILWTSDLYFDAVWNRAQHTHEWCEGHSVAFGRIDATPLRFMKPRSPCGGPCLSSYEKTMLDKWKNKRPQQMGGTRVERAAMQLKTCSTV